MKQMRGFTMIEMVFVIVILGILAAVAIPRLVATRDDAVLTKGQSQVSAIRSGIVLQKSKRMLEGTTPFIPTALDGVTTYNADNQRLFNFSDGNSSNILEYPIYSKTNHDGSWVKTAANQYAFKLSNVANAISFDYNTTTGSFECNQNDQNCKDLTK